jgi:Cys-rich protein (TIGR01571 family)
MMDGASYHRYPQVSDVPALPALSKSQNASSGRATAYPPDDKADPGTSGMHDADSIAYVNSITPEDARYFRKQADDIAPSSQSSGASPTKLKRELHPKPHVVNLVPDENPLGPRYPRSLNHTQNVTTLSDSTIGDHLPGQAVHANQQMKGGTWKYGLCDFGEIGVCCTGIWCPCIIYGKTQHRLSQRSERKDPSNMLGFSIFNGSCAAFAVLCGCNLILAAIQHSRVRQAYDIPGGVGSDFMRGCYCCCCTLSQDEKEIKSRETQARMPSAPTMQYASPEGMNFAAPFK